MIILRVSESDEGTFGYAVVAGRMFRSLELPDRDNRTNVSRIPAGVYDIEYVKTGRPHGGRWFSYWLKDVPGRSGILIHSGNWAGDRFKGLKTNSWGCILLGQAVGVLGGQRAVISSKSAVYAFNEAMRHRSGKLRIIG